MNDLSSHPTIQQNALLILLTKQTPPPTQNKPPLPLSLSLYFSPQLPPRPPLSFPLYLVPHHTQKLLSIFSPPSPKNNEQSPPSLISPRLYKSHQLFPLHTNFHTPTNSSSSNKSPYFFLLYMVFLPRFFTILSFLLALRTHHLFFQNQTPHQGGRKHLERQPILSALQHVSSTRAQILVLLQ